MSVRFYDENAEAFFDGTVSVDMSALRGRFLAYVRAGGRILDAGCGSGRDALAFSRAGYGVTAFDASPEMVRRAAAHTGLSVALMSFDDVDWSEAFDGVWACASLLHVPRLALSLTLARLMGALRPGGVIYASFKDGLTERVSDGRTFTDLSLAGLDAVMRLVGLEILDLWTSDEVRLDRPGERWVNGIDRRRI